ncbi:unnamed protein product [Spirodela intermedia]|uniref:Large ribosomal subunit protein uL4c n=1 Tax=Spirodela intermedia TaxID=51605 RepID=A0A7I8IE48_SPIIN|nr:unnamed protein product [Spirodela intermedia]CAA6655111.1 unnamed protein product [Spirodela intermedia]
MPMAAPSTSLAFLSSSIFHRSSPKQLPCSLPCTRLHASRAGRPSLGVRSELATLPVLSFSGEKVGEAALDLRSAPPETARAVVHRGLVTHMQNKRRGTASTLTRGEVRGGGRKPYPQKKTGARGGGRRGRRYGPGEGSSSAPSPRTGGTPKTKEFVAALKRWGLDPKDKVTFMMTEVPENVLLSCRNIGTVKVLTPRTLNLFDVLDAKNLIFTRSALEYLNSVYGEDAEEADDTEEEEEEGS